jgi:hypothetical protein
MKNQYKVSLGKTEGNRKPGTLGIGRITLKFV